MSPDPKAGTRHLGGGRRLLVERHPPGWVAAVEESSRERDGVRMTIRDIARLAPDTLSATNERRTWVRLIHD